MENLNKTERELKPVADFGSDIAELSSETSKIQTLLGLIDEYFYVADTQNPTDEEKYAYSSGCGTLYALIASISNCVECIDECATPLMKEV